VGPRLFRWNLYIGWSGTGLHVGPRSCRGVEAQLVDQGVCIAAMGTEHRLSLYIYIESDI
jgi:hypothetical protein